ncbi:MAG: glyoxalase [Candidatus Eremiobacteraeota bacterium]|nr:glyoxalase [Candidatus Eremiobacteraeota bacterium]
MDHVQIAIPYGGEATARAFYVGILGFVELPKPNELAERGGAWFRHGDVTLHVGVDKAFIPATKAHPALRCVNYPALLAHLEEHGIDTLNDSLLFEGRPHCYISDPFGNRLELIG